MRQNKNVLQETVSDMCYVNVRNEAQKMWEMSI
jgi:hypothetical protein